MLETRSGRYRYVFSTCVIIVYGWRVLELRLIKQTEDVLKMNACGGECRLEQRYFSSIKRKSSGGTNKGMLHVHIAHMYIHGKTFYSFWHQKLHKRELYIKYYKEAHVPSQANWSIFVWILPISLLRTYHLYC